jgi:tetratricopeptide (TPR) repeat protein
MTIDFENLFLQADNFRNSARVKEAIAAYEDIASLAQEEHMLDLQARALHMAGVSAKESVTDQKSSYYRDAQNYFDLATKIYQQIDDQVGLGDVYRDRAITADYAGDSVMAEEYFTKSLEILKQTEAVDHLAITYDKLGVHFFKLGQLNEAEEKINQALELVHQTPLAGFVLATILLDLARVLYKKGDFRGAKTRAEESLSWFEADHDQEKYDRRLAQLYSLMSLIQAQLNQDQSAKSFWQKYQNLLVSFDSEAIHVLQKDLENLGN